MNAPPNDPLALVLVLLVAGYLLLLLELLVIPGFGAAGLAGLACLGAGSYLAFHYYGGLAGGLVVTGVIAVTSALLVLLPRTRWGRPLIHRASLAGATSSASRLAAGDRGMAESDLRPAGIARFGEERESVVTDGEYIAAGTPVRVIEVAGSRVVVETDDPSGAGDGADDGAAVADSARSPQGPRGPRSPQSPQSP